MSKTKYKKVLLITAIVLIVLFAVSGVFFYLASKKINTLLIEQLQETQGVEALPVEQQNLLTSLLPKILGFDKSKTYLVLFLNNTELRPGGGFIGTYGVVKVDKGRASIEKVDGVENLDNNAPSSPKPEPPQPLKDYLGVGRWWFRDSNWSPDFKESSKKGFELYLLEQGYKARELDGIIGFTPTVLEKILGIVGPIKADGMEFTSENVTRKLEYEVEYGYVDRNIPVENRKDIVGDLLDELFKKVAVSIIFNWQEYIDLAIDLANEKHIIVYSFDNSLQKQLTEFSWTGEVKDVDGDYLMWVDANLGALKTDHAIKRKLNYKISPQTNGRLLATATMEFKHTGSFDWRTSRYLDYARVFVPKGAILDKVVRVQGGKEEIIAIQKIDKGEELNKSWFGTFFRLEPGDTASLSFSYYLPEDLTQKIKSDGYTILNQKQLGVVETGLTFYLDFDKNLTGAFPPEKQEKWYDDVYEYETNLKIDQEVRVEF